jgi:hypothetical protein
MLDGAEDLSSERKRPRTEEVRNGDPPPGGPKEEERPPAQTENPDLEEGELDD